MNLLFIFFNIILIIGLSIIITDMQRYFVFANRFTKKNRIQILFEGLFSFFNHVCNIPRNKKNNFSSTPQVFTSYLIFIYSIFTYYNLVYGNLTTSVYQKCIILIIGIILFITHSTTVINSVFENEKFLVLKSSLIILLYFLVDNFFEYSNINPMISTFKALFAILSISELYKIKLDYSSDNITFSEKVFLELSRNTLIIFLLDNFLSDSIRIYIKDSSIIIFGMMLICNILNLLVLKQEIGRFKIFNFRESLTSSFNILLKISIIRIILWKL